MNIFEKVFKKNVIKDSAPVEETVVKEPVVEEEAVQEEIAEPTKQSFRINYEDGKTYDVIANSREEAISKLDAFFDKPVREEKKKEEFVLTVRDCFNAIAEEIDRIVTLAHPESYNQSYDRWVSVIGEEFGEIVHELNDEFEGKEPTKNTFVECVQLCAATILLAKKFAREHAELFTEDDGEEI